LVGVPVQAHELVGVDSGAAFAVVAEHRYEAAQPHRVRSQYAVLAVDERDAAGVAAPAQRHDQPPAGGR